MANLTIFTTQTPAITDSQASEGAAGITVGTAWYTDLPGAVYGIRFYLGNRNYDGRPVTVGLYDGMTNALLAQQTYTVTSSDPIGFVTVSLAAPTIVKRQYPYVVAAYFQADNSPDGKSHYAYTDNFFGTQLDSVPLHAYKDDQILTRYNGLTATGSALTNPTNNANGTCFFIDPVFNYISTIHVFNQSTGKQEEHPIKIRQGGQWVF